MYLREHRALRKQGLREREDKILCAIIDLCIIFSMKLEQFFHRQKHPEEHVCTLQCVICHSLCYTLLASSLTVLYPIVIMQWVPVRLDK